MCRAECFGNFHRKCEHFVKQYESGIIEDCGNPLCGLSKAHKHPPHSRTCTCPKVYGEKRRVLNLIQDRCDDCTAAAWAALDPDNSRRW